MLVSKFYFLLWIDWLIRVTISTLLLSFIFSSIVTLFLYIYRGTQSLNSEVYEALIAIFEFWFTLFLSLALLISLIRSLKGVFNRCRGGYRLLLYSCEKELDEIESIGLGDLRKVWRKWLMLLVWFVAVEMVIGVVLNKLIGTEESLFNWFSIYLLYGFIAVAGYFSFIVLTSRCKQVKIKRC